LRLQGSVIRASEVMEVSPPSGLHGGLSPQVPDESFPVLLLYIEGLRGAARDLTVQKAEALVKSLGDGPWDPEQQQKMQRAREVLQLLS
jgi:hypothetical protein